MFRIDRNLVNLGAVRTINTIQAGSETDEDDEIIEAGVAGGTPDAAASAAAMAQMIRSTAEAEAKAKAHDIIVKAEAEAKAKAEAGAETIIANARKEAAALIIDAREQVEEERRSARQEGYTQGAEEGKRSYDKQLEEKLRGLNDEYEGKINEDDEKLKRVIEELYDERTRAYDALEEQTVALAMGIVRKVINPPDGGPGGVFEMLIRNALKQINQDRKIIIRVGPAEYDRFFPSGSAIFELDNGATVTASVLRDAALGESDCVIDAEDETVNVGLESQLKYVQLAFDRAV